MTIKHQALKSKHDAFITELASWLSLQGISVSYPNSVEEAEHDASNDDHGFDFKIGSVIFDMKSFPLLFINGSASWDSSHWHGRSPHREGLQNDFYVFPYGSYPGEWKVMSRALTRASHKGFGPYCWTSELLSINDIVTAQKVAQKGLQAV
jgi:hypothetical protein